MNSPEENHKKEIPQEDSRIDRTVLEDKEIEELYHQIKQYGKVSEESMQTGPIDIPQAPDLRPLKEEEKKSQRVPKKVDGTKEKKSSKEVFSKKKRIVTGILLALLILVLAGSASAGLTYLLRDGKLPFNSSDPNLDNYQAPESFNSDGIEEVSSEAVGDLTSDFYTQEEFPTTGFSSSDATITVETVNDRKEASNGTLAFTISMQRPTLFYPTNSPAESVIQKQLNTLFEEAMHSAQTMAADYSSSFKDGDAIGSYESVCSLISAQEEILTFMVTTYAYNGGASPLVTVECYNFRAQNGTLLQISDLLSDIDALCTMAIERVDRNLVWESVFESAIRDTVCDSFYFTKEGLVLIYQKYSIGPGASGTIEVTIPYADFSEIVQDEFRTLLQ